MWDLNFGTWISHRGFTVAFGHGHPLVVEQVGAVKIHAAAVEALRKSERRVKNRMKLSFPQKNGAILSFFHPLPLRLMYLFAVVLNLTRFWCCVVSSRKTLLCSWACAHSQFSCFKIRPLRPPLPKIEAHGLPFALLPPLQVIYYMQVKEIEVLGGREGLDEFLKKEKKKEIYMQLIKLAVRCLPSSINYHSPH